MRQTSSIHWCIWIYLLYINSYISHIYLCQIRIHATFYLLLVAIQKHGNQRSVACATCVQLWQHAGSIRTHSMRTQRKAPAVFACTGDTHSVEGSILTKSQGRPTWISTQYQRGKTARINCERMKWVLTDRVQECTYAAVQLECRYAHIHCPWFALSPLLRIRTWSYIFQLILTLSCLTNTPHRQREVVVVGYEEMHAQNQTQRPTRLKEKREDCSIKEVGGKRWECTRAKGMGPNWRRRGNSHSCSTSSGRTAGRWSKVADRESKRIPTFHTWQHGTKSVFDGSERGQTRLLNFSASTSGNKKRKRVCWRGTYFLFRWKQSMNSKSHANAHKLVTFLILENW